MTVIFPPKDLIYKRNMTEIIVWNSIGSALTASFPTKWAPLIER
jgi:hypothetical protein